MTLLCAHVISINNADAKVNATITTNLATMKAYLLVTQSEADSYAAMKKELGFKKNCMFYFENVIEINVRMYSFF